MEPKVAEELARTQGVLAGFTDFEDEHSIPDHRSGVWSGHEVRFYEDQKVKVEPCGRFCFIRTRDTIENYMPQRSPGTNSFRDFSRLPEEEGILFFGISMSLIGNKQSPEKCFEYLKWIDTKIKKTEGIGMVMWYGDYLYFQSQMPAKLLRDRYKELMLSHKNGFLKLILKDPAWIKKAFSFYTFGQVMLDNSEVFVSAWSKTLAFYNSDERFRKYIENDCEVFGHGLGEGERMFILEEILAYYLASKGQLNFNNRFVPGTEQWVLLGYPGKPLKSEVYLYQKNPLKLSNPRNQFENCFYDIEGKILYDYTRLDIDTFDFS